MNFQLQFGLFQSEDIFNTIKAHWLKWAQNVQHDFWVVGISGGVDSAVVAALAAKLFGPQWVIGVQLPCGVQSDISDSDLVVEHLGLNKVTCNIGTLFEDLKSILKNQNVTPSEQCCINAPARLRMTTLYAVAQSTSGVVLNTCNLSETVVGNDTLFGDSCGSYAPIKRLIKTEVVKLAEWLGLPDRIAHKTPIDGLQPETDEQRLGLTYREIDDYLRGTALVSDEVAAKIVRKYNANRFKFEMINVPGLKFPWLFNRLAL